MRKKSTEIVWEEWRERANSCGSIQTRNSIVNIRILKERENKLFWMNLFKRGTFGLKTLNTSFKKIFIRSFSISRTNAELIQKLRILFPCVQKKRSFCNPSTEKKWKDKNLTLGWSFVPIIIRSFGWIANVEICSTSNWDESSCPAKVINFKRMIFWSEMFEFMFWTNCIQSWFNLSSSWVWPRRSSFWFLFEGKETIDSKSSKNMNFVGGVAICDK